MNISYLLKFLWKRKWLIIIPTLLAIGISWWFSRNQAAQYTSIAELSTGYMDVNPLNSNSLSQNNTVLFNNVIQTLQSPQVLDQVAYSLLLQNLQGNNTFPRNITSKAAGIISNYPGGKNGLLISLSNKIDSFYVLDLARKEDRMIRELADDYGYSPEALLKNLQIARIENTDFIMITATTADPALSAFISNNICRRFLALYQSNLGRSSTTSLDTLRSLMETKKQILDNKLQLLQGESDPDLSGSVGMLGMLQSQLTQQRTNLIAAQVALESVNKQIAASGKQGGLANNEEIIALRTNIDNLYAKYVNGGSTDAGLLHQIDLLRNTLQQKLSAMGTGTGSVPLNDLTNQKMDWDVKINVANQTIKDLEDKIRVLQGSVQSSSARQNVAQGIQGEIDVARQQYENANNLYNEALNRNMFPGNNFKQVLLASPSLHSDPSKIAKTVGFSAVGVFFFIIFLLLFFEFIDPAIKIPSYLKANLPFPLLANFRYIRTRKLPIEEIFKTETHVSKSLKSFKEQVKQLRYEVQQSGKKIFLVAGYHKKSGRTTLIESLAGSLSLSNRKVLLVDSNFDNNLLTKKYNANAALETFKPNGDQASVSKAIMDLTVPSKEENIRIIGCNMGDYTPEEVLPEKNLLSALKEKCIFDYVLIDCAALSQGPDCKELLKYVDAVILAFAADQPLTEEDKKLIAYMQQNNGIVLGAVLNKVPAYSIES